MDKKMITMKLMNKKIIAVILGVAVAGGVGTAAYASSMHSGNSNSKTKVERHHREDKKEKSKIERFKWIKEQLEQGKTVKDIKAGLESRFKTEIDKRVQDKKIDSQKATELINKYNERLAKANIFKGVVKGKTVQQDLMNGKTLKEAEADLIKTKTDNINKLVQEKKITSEEGKTKITKLTERINRGEGVFVDYNHHKKEGQKQHKRNENHKQREEKE